MREPDIKAGTGGWRMSSACMLAVSYTHLDVYKRQVIAYVIARQNEIKTVRIILSGKLNDLPDDSIRERVREMYV